MVEKVHLHGLNINQSTEMLGLTQKFLLITVNDILSTI